MKANQDIEDKIVVGIPTEWYRKDTPNQLTDGYNNPNAFNESDYIYDGWRDVVNPTYNTESQKLGAIYYDKQNDNYTYSVIEKTPEEIQIELISNAKSEQASLIQQTLEIQVVEQAQTLDNESALENQAIYPMWEVPFYYTVGFKCQHFTAENELALYRCEQAHESQEAWQPKDVPALFTRVALPDEVLPWVQPTGAQDAYQIGDKVTHLGQTWLCIVSNNVWAPGVYGWEIFSAKLVEMTKEELNKYLTQFK